MKHYKPGDVYKMLGMTREALRYYLSVGLVSPSYVDDKNRAYFSDRELMRLMMIRYYRGADVPSGTVRELIQSGNADEQERIINDSIREIEKQMEQLQIKKEALERKRYYIRVSNEDFGCVMYDPVGREMWSLNIEDAMRLTDGKGIQMIEAMASYCPETFISLNGELDDFIQRRPMRVKLGFGISGERVTEHMRRQFDPNVLKPQRKAACLYARLRVKDPLKMTPEELEPLYAEIERRKCTVIDGVYGHLINVIDTCYHVTMRVYIR